MIQFCEFYWKTIQVSFCFRVDLFESLLSRVWQRIYIQVLFMNAVAVDTVEMFFSKSDLQN